MTSGEEKMVQIYMQVLTRGQKNKLMKVLIG